MSQLFAAYRELGVVSGRVPFKVNKKGTENYVVVACEASFQIFHCAKLHLVFVGGQHPHRISALEVWQDLTITAARSDIYMWSRGSNLVHCFHYDEATVAPVKKLMCFGEEHLLVLREDNTVSLLHLPTRRDEGVVITLDQSTSGEITTLIHPPTYLNKVLLGTSTGLLQIWNIKTRKMIFESQTFVSTTASISCMQSSPAVDVVAVGMTNGGVALHNVRTDETLFRVQHGTTNNVAVTAISFRTDGPALMVTCGAAGGSVCVWDLEKHKLKAMLHNVHDYETPVHSAEFLHGEPVLVTAGADNALKMWIFDNPSDAGAARLLRARSGHVSPPTKIAFYGEDGRNILSCGSEDRAVRVICVVRDQQCMEMSQGKGLEKKAIKKHRDVEDMKLPPAVDISGVAHPRARQWDSVITAHVGKKSAQLWSYERKALGVHTLKQQDPRPTRISSVVMSPCGNFAFTGSESGWIDRFNVQSGLHRGSFVGHTDRVTGLVVNAVGKHLISTSLDGTIRFWDVDTAQQIHQITPGSPVTHLRINLDNNLVVVASDDCLIRVYDAGTHTLARRFSGHTRHVTDLAFSDDGRWVVSASVDKTIRVWDLPSGRMIDWFCTKKPATSIALSPTGDFLATTHVGRLGVFLWTNKAYFSSVLLHTPSAVPVNLELPSLTGPKSKSKQKSLAAVEEEAKVREEQERLKQAETVSAERPDEGLVTLSKVAGSKWKTLDKLELIRERNKPKLNKTEEASVPFFIPTLAGLQPQFAPLPDEEKDKKPEEEEEQQPVSRILTGMASMKTALQKQLEAAEKSGGWTAVTDYLKEMAPSAVDYEFRSLPVSDPDVARSMITFFQQEVDKQTNFEIAQAYLHHFLKVHSDVLATYADLQPAIATLLDSLKKSWTRLESLFHSNLCMINYTTGMHT